MDQASQLLADTLNAEMDRFWTRFNIFAAIQVGALVGMLNASAFLLANHLVVRFAFVILIVFSVTGAIAVFRGFDLQRALVLALGEVEQSLPDNQRVLSLTAKHFRFPTFISNWSASIFAVFCCVCWTAAWVWLEATDFALAIGGNP